MEEGTEASVEGTPTGAANTSNTTAPSTAASNATAGTTTPAATTANTSTTTTATTTPKKDLTSALTALQGSCFPPTSSAASPASTPLRGNFVAEPPDWSLIGELPQQQQTQQGHTNQTPQQQQGQTPQQTPGHTNQSGQVQQTPQQTPQQQTPHQKMQTPHLQHTQTPGPYMTPQRQELFPVPFTMNRSYDNSPRGGSIATSFSGSSQGGGTTGVGSNVGQGVSVQGVNSQGASVGVQGVSSQGSVQAVNSQGSVQAVNSGGASGVPMPPFLPHQGTQPQLSLSVSGDSGGQPGQGQQGSQQGGQQQHGQGSQGSQQGGADASVLLGLEELERQQADLEKRRANEAIRKQQEQNKPAYSSGLPPLAPVPSDSHVTPHRQSQTEIAVPSQVHILDEEETLTSEVTDRGVRDGGDGDGDMKKVNSIEKLGKLRGQMSVSLRRFRSWSMSNTPENNPGSVDSTQKETLSRGSGTPSGPASTPDQPATQTIQEPYLEDGELKPIICGYLHKLGRNGHWQKRFFETNGKSLTYYKNVKRTKVLATLDLCKVGEIAKDLSDPEQSTFTIQVSNRPYYLRAEDKTQCNDWVITLNRAREARMNVGNIQLVTPKLDDPHRSQAGSDEYAPCIVISALRPRTHGSDLPPDLLTCHTEEEQQQIEVMGNWDHFQDAPTEAGKTPSPKKTIVPTAQTPMAKWQKKHSTMHQLSLRFLKWARSITKQADACRRETDVVVVPAHVLRTLTAQQTTTEPAVAPPPTGTSSARRKGSGSGSDLPVLAEEAPMTEGRTDGQNRSRTSTESTAGGIVGSQYV